MSRINRYFLSVILLTWAGLTQAVAQQQTGNATLPGHLYVQFDAEITSPAAGSFGIEAFDRQAAKFGVSSIKKAFPSLELIAQHRTLSAEAEALRSVYVVRYASPHQPERVAKRLGGMPGVRYAEPVYMHQVVGGADDHPNPLSVTPNDPMFADQTHLGRMRLPEAWDVVKGEDDAVVIAIVDGGTAWQHEDLEANVWTNPNEIADNGIDDDNNGFVDDLHGWNFLDNKPDPTGRPGTVSAEHGTLVAGAAAAATNNMVGIAGTSWNARFMPINAACDGADAVCFVPEVLLYAGMNGADIITASFGTPVASETELNAIRAVLAEGALVVAASGNDGEYVDVTGHYPSSFSETLSVGGLNKDDDENQFNYGLTVNVYAPAMDINTTRPTGYGIASGTSLAAPLVAGVAALVKTANPSWGPERIREQIRLTAVNIEAANPGYEPGSLGRGRVDAYAAVTEAPLPALRVVDWSFVNQDGEAVIRVGDQVTLTVNYKNFHGDGEGVVAKLVEDEYTYPDWQVQEISLGAVPHGATVSAEYSFTMDDVYPYDGILGFIPEITAGTLVDRSDLIILPVIESGVATHSTAALEVTVTEEGNIGHTSYSGEYNSSGDGFRVQWTDGEWTDVLHEGGLLIATSANQVSDCVREAEDEYEDQQEDFVVSQGSSIEIASPGTHSAQEGRVTFTDVGAANPIDVEVLQESFTDDDAANEDFIIMRYEITNTSGDRLSDLHVGLFFDWDLNPFPEDATAFDAAREVGYVMDASTNAQRVVGTVLLSDSPATHYRAIDNDAVITRYDSDGFTPQEKWDSMTGGLQDGGVVSQLKDVSQLTAAGPFALESTESVVVAFAVVAGRSESDFLANVDQAIARWGAVGTQIGATPIAENEWTVHAPYPNPATFPATIRFATGGAGAVEVAIYDVLGRRVRQLMQGARRQGEHTITWDGRNDQGTRVSSGLYLVRMQGTGNHEPVLRSQPILVVQ